MSSELSLSEIKKEYHGTLKSYLIGFTLSIILTAISFTLVMTQALTGHVLAATLMSLAVLQAVVQLLCFLHLGREESPRWETLTFCFTVLVLLIILIGSLWIMNDLEYRMMPDMDHGNSSTETHHHG